MAETVTAKFGYYVQDTGDGDVYYYYYYYYYFMGDEPPLEQYILIDGTWEPLSDGFYLMDMVIDGNPEISGPVRDPPEGVPPYESPPART